MTTPLLQDQYDVCVPCRAACPIRTDVPGYIEAILDGDLDTAQAINRRDNVFPGVLGRVCHRPCEPACRHGRQDLGDPVQICFLKRAASDLSSADTAPTPVPKNGKRICIIGSGPSGLTAANDLALAGCDVTVLEQYDQPGGMMQYGIPEFRLPRDIVAKDIQSILDLGVDLRTSIQITDRKQLDDLHSKHDAVIIAGGCMQAAVLHSQDPGFKAAVPGLDYMQAVNRGTLKQDPDRVVVIGGGFTAVDCARSALRLGAAEVTLVYRRTKEFMRVGPNEIKALEEEGVRTVFLHSPLRIRMEDQVIKAIEFTPMRMANDGTLSETEASPFIIATEEVILAIGQETDDTMQASEAAEKTDGLYLTGDFRDGSGTVIEACAAGRTTARQLLVDLGVTAVKDDPLRLEPVPHYDWKRGLDDNIIPQIDMPDVPVSHRMNQQIEVETGFSAEQAREEARRCYLCNYTFTIDADACIYCMKCIDAMPVNCISLTRGGIAFTNGKLDAKPEQNYNHADGIVIDYDECVRCGECVRACPVDCISIEKFTTTPAPR